MTTQAFSSSISERYKGASSVELRDIIEAVAPLTDQGRDVLWRAFLDSYEFSTVPKRAVFAKLIDKHSIQFTVREHKSAGAEYCCYICGARFPLDSGHGCPNCRNNDKHWIRVIQAGAQRSHKLKADEETERDEVFNDRMGKRT